ncbi:MAG: hypothetical protein V1711_00480 [bacterium]
MEKVPEKNRVENKEQEIELEIEGFYKRQLEQKQTGDKRVSLNELMKLKEKGITTEKFLDYICKKYKKLLHGSIREIVDEKLKSEHNKIFTTNKSAVAIMRSLYSNENVNLEYPYFISKEKPLTLKIHTKTDGTVVKTNKGFVYVVDDAGFQNDPEGSWQFVKEAKEVEFKMSVEIEDKDFNYSVEFFNDLDLQK